MVRRSRLCLMGADADCGPERGGAAEERVAPELVAGGCSGLNTRGIDRAQIGSFSL